MRPRSLGSVSLSQWSACTIRMAGRPAQVQLAWCRVFELDDQVVQLNRSAPRVCVNDDACWYRRGQAQVIRSGHPIDEHAQLVAPPDRVDDPTVVGNRRLTCQAVSTRYVIEAAVDASKVALLYEPLQDLVNGGAATEVEEIDGRPDLVARRLGDTGGDSLPQVSHPIFVHKFRTLHQSKSSDICPQVSDIHCAQNCAQTTSKGAIQDQRGQLKCGKLGRKTRDLVGWDGCDWD